MEKSSKRSVRITIIFIVCLMAFLAIAAYYFPYRAGLFGQKGSQLINLKEIEADIYSSTDGTSHKVSAWFTLEVEEKDRSYVDSSEVREHITLLMQGLDYDKITAEGNVAYIKEEIREGLKAYEEDSYIDSIYIRDLSSGSIRIISSDDQKNQRGDGNAVQELLDKMGR